MSNTVFFLLVLGVIILLVAMCAAIGFLVVALFAGISLNKFSKQLKNRK